MTTQSATLKVRYHGSTDDHTTCDHCGRSGLKKTVMLFILDADGNAEELTYYGTSCAATALGTTNAKVTRAATEADEARKYRMRTLTLRLNHMDPMGRFPSETRKVWTESVRGGRPLLVDGIEYGPKCGEGRMFLAFAAAQADAWKRELAFLAG